MEKKEMCQRYLDELTEEQATSLLFLFQYANGSKNKGDVMKFTNRSRNVDSAIPLMWSTKVRDLGIEPTWYAVSYLEEDGGTYGQPIHLVEKFFDKIMKDLEIS